MKTTWWFSGLVSLSRLARAAQGIETQLRRIADAHEGISPPGRETTEEPPEPPTVAPPASTRADQFVLIDAVERQLTRAYGRPPTPEEIVHEMDGLEWGAADLTPAQREKLGL